MNRGDAISKSLHYSKKQNDTQKSVILFMAEDMGLEPTGLLHLT